MKKYLLTLLMAIAAIPASAQYYEIANQIPQLISPALSGSFNYKGFVEAAYLKGIGSRNADFLEFSTTQGFRYSSWFFMGVGIGVDVLFAHTDDTRYGYGQPSCQWPTDKDLNANGVMVPLYTDFRFTAGNPAGVSFFADIRFGCSFLVSNSYIRIDQGYLSSSENFYFRPSIGLRIATNSSNPKQAIDLGVTYQLITSNYWYSYSRNVCLNALGVSVGYEW